MRLCKLGQGGKECQWGQRGLQGTFWHAGTSEEEGAAMCIAVTEKLINSNVRSSYSTLLLLFRVLFQVTFYVTHFTGFCHHSDTLRPDDSTGVYVPQCNEVSS